MCTPPMLVAATGNRKASAPKEAALGRLLAVAVLHLKGAAGKTESKKVCLVRFSGSTIVDGQPCVADMDCFVGLKSVARGVGLDDVVIPEPVKWGSDLEQVADNHTCLHMHMHTQLLY
jgi:hypothetical protein